MSTSTDAWGIQQDWVDADDQPQRASDATVATLREVIGEPPPDLEERAPVVTRPGRSTGIRSTVTCEDGSTRELDDVVPEDFPLGYHRLADGRRLIVSPGRCHVPQEQAWGWTVQLYAARSRRSWGIGDLRDLRTLREWTEQLGGGFLLVNPLHAVAPTVPQETSPYLPATRRFRNPLYLAVEDVPGVEDADLERHDAELATLRAAGLVERDGAWTLKRSVLRAVFDRSPEDPSFAAWRAAAGPAVEGWATWCALAEEHGPDRLAWPEAVRRQDAGGVAAYVREHAEDIGFHVWLQWLLDGQLRAATGSTTVLQDLPIGVSGSGADAWAWDDVLATGVTVGAPPDMLNSVGQDWGSPPLVPWRLRAADYEPFVESIRGTIAGAGGLRIDHVMGLFRLWWIPADAGPQEGAYVRYPADDLLDIVALESHRAGAVVVGEDLGTVEPGVREALAERGILSYKVLWFEDEPPARWPEGALAAVTTHDLPTVAGLWTGSDVVDQLAATDMAEDDVRSGREDLLERLRRDGLAADAPVEDAVVEAYRQLGTAPSLLLSVALEDAVAEERRPNVPGTTERDNWRLPLGVPLEDLGDHPGVARLLAAMRGEAPEAASDRGRSVGG
ncbi:4-alpha-glucanotransferase [Nocardioides sp. zg-579]|uniref:4-alpha-glucanotransferase n=1 Tax=Nocardioides marmotae TaxID=2663857 RepID=A0A6I3JFD8_9ACTN|nr:4-alpha-glucanotransferase [Nocardioides marmotae]MCR6033159.1 4-alpha-glucanotransferase [Gordonia jinghuaiqii]MTB96812.1 4-alpha-glucanotransferase [Nocardioides marmotae]QKE02985.1 4-alpha-glucanotransferase [Nocardioides marmotae]